MKIAFMIPGLGVVDRGAEHAVLELSKKLSRNISVTIYSRGEKRELKKYHGIKIIIIPAVSRDNKIFNYIYNLFPGLKSFFDRFNLSPQALEMLTFSLASLPSLLFRKYDILFPVSGFWGALSCALVRAINGTPFIYASHGGEEPLITRLNPNCYIALTPYTQKWLKKFRPALKVVNIPNGVDTKMFSPFIKPAKVILEKPIFLTAAALIPAKRIELAIKAVSGLGRGSLLVLGDGPLRQMLEKSGRKLLGPHRFAIKKVPYEKMPNYYKAAAVFTLPSLADPSPLVYLEAAAAGLPIVAPAEQRRRTSLGKLASYCNVENIAEYSLALQSACRKHPIRKSGMPVLDYDWGLISKKYEKVFIDMVED